MSATATAVMNLDVPEEERQDVSAEEAYARLLARLSHQSVVKHFDAYADVPWDDAAFALDPTDPRLELSVDDPLGATAWYQNQPQAVRAQLGLQMFATFARLGIAFEAVLKRGLLAYTARLPLHAPEFRYAYHEIIEEAQHSLMFREFVQRAGLDDRPPAILRLAQGQIIRFGRSFPELFFMFVLSGEDPIDWAQRKQLHSGRPLHPLVERIARIHITEEARHMAFARHFLRRNVPRLRGLKRHVMRIRTPMVLAVASSLMLKPSAQLVRGYGIPPATMREAYGKGSRHRAFILEALRKPRELCWELGILDERTTPLWKALGIWAPRPV